MSFVLLLSHLPHVDQSRAHYDTLLSLQPVRPGRFRRLMSLARALTSRR